jgi:hypothetical protein
MWPHGITGMCLRRLIRYSCGKIDKSEEIADYGWASQPVAKASREADSSQEIGGEPIVASCDVAKILQPAEHPLSGSASSIQHRRTREVKLTCLRVPKRQPRESRSTPY